MARKKRDQPQLSADLARRVIIFLVVLVVMLLLIRGVIGYMNSSGIFLIKDVNVVGDLQKLDLVELDKLKGQRIFSVDLSRIEARLRSHYPQLADIRFLRRFPDQISVSAIQREEFARVALGGHVSVIDRKGWMIRPLEKSEDAFVLIKGLKDQRLLAGEQVKDGRIRFAVDMIELFAKSSIVATFPLRSIDVGDMTRVVCTVGQSGATLDVFMDSSSFSSRMHILETLLLHGSIDFSQVNYMDLRFKEPVIGKKKVKKI